MVSIVPRLAVQRRPLGGLVMKHRVGMAGRRTLSVSLLQSSTGMVSRSCHPSLARRFFSSSPKQQKDREVLDVIYRVHAANIEDAKNEQLRQEKVRQFHAAMEESRKKEEEDGERMYDDNKKPLSRSWRGRLMVIFGVLLVLALCYYMLFPVVAFAAIGVFFFDLVIKFTIGRSCFVCVLHRSVPEEKIRVRMKKASGQQWKEETKIVEMFDALPSNGRLKKASPRWTSFESSWANPRKKKNKPRNRLFCLQKRGSASLTCTEL
jgi:hypothetical protein